MNKLIFFCLLSLMVIYTQCEACGDIKSPAKAADCEKATGVPDGKVCSFVAAKGEGESATPAKCELTAKPTTNSSDILNIFKTTLALLIIFTIL
jgi:hypothetical protein